MAEIASSTTEDQDTTLPSMSFRLRRPAFFRPRQDALIHGSFFSSCIQFLNSSRNAKQNHQHRASISQVDPLWREADQLQVQALTNFFRVPINLFYLDQTPGDKCNLYSQAFDGGDAVINLLYRPGHYELLYKS